MKIMNQYRKLISVFLVIVLGLSPLLSASAQEAWGQTQMSEQQPNSTQQSDDCVRGLGPQPIYPDAAKAAHFTTRLLDSEQFAIFQTKLLENYADEFSIQLPTLKVIELKEIGRVGVYVIISGGAGESFYAEWYDEQTDTLITALSSLFSLTPEKNISATIDADGYPLVRATLTMGGELLNGSVWVDGKLVPMDWPVQTTEAADNFFTCFLSCLPTCGVPDWLTSLIDSICGLICSVFGFPCWWCIVIQIGIWLPCAIDCWGVCSPKTVYLPMVTKSN